MNVLMNDSIIKITPAGESMLNKINTTLEIQKQFGWSSENDGYDQMIITVTVLGLVKDHEPITLVELNKLLEPEGYEFDDVAELFSENHDENDWLK